MSDVSSSRGRVFSTGVHIMALDGIVNVNSLFSVAVFLGLSLHPSGGGATATCAAGAAIAERLVSFHVYSFSSFLFSSLVASGLKQAIAASGAGADLDGARVDLRVLRAGILASAAGSVSGCVFLTLALVDLVQIRLGTLACRSFYSIAAVGPLVTLVPSALVIYVCIALHAFTR